MIQVKKISKHFGEEINAISNITFEVKEGEIVYVLGESGSGKTTLLRVLGGLEDADTGSVYVNQEKITGPSQHLVPGFDHIAFLPQHFKLQEFWTVWDNIGNKISFWPEDEKKARVDQLLKIFKLEEKADKYPRELSGGQRQRIALAATLANEPEVMLLDEPFSNLDLSMKAEIRIEIIEMLREAEVTVLLVSHDPADALAVADRIAILNQGILEQFDTPKNIYHHPLTHYAAKFVGPVNQVQLNGKPSLLRPEQFSIVEQGNYRGKVTKSLFLGRSYHIMVQTDICDKELLFYANTPQNTGSQINFDIK